MMFGNALMGPQMSGLLNPQQPKSTGTGLLGLLGDPRLMIAMNLLSAGRDRRIDPFQSALSGLMQAQQFRNASDDQERVRAEEERKQAEAERKAWEHKQKVELSERIAALRNPMAMAHGALQGPPQAGEGPLMREGANPPLALLSQIDPVLAAKTSIQGGPTSAIGKYNPRDYTTESWDKFYEGGYRDPSDLKRYEPYKVVNNSDGTTQLIDKSTGEVTTIRTAQDVADTAATLSDADVVLKFKQGYAKLKSHAVDAVERMTEVRDQIKDLDTGPISGPLMEKISSEYQLAQAALTNEALMYIAALADQGVRLNPLTEQEITILFNTSAQLTSYPEANVELLNKRIERWREVLKDIEHQKAHYDKGGTPSNYEGRRREQSEPQTNLTPEDEARLKELGY